MDIVLTVCDQAAGELCPVWPGQPVSAHWGVDDPAKVVGSDADKRRAFVRAYAALSGRINLLIALPPKHLERLSLACRPAEIGRGAEASIAK